MFTLKLYNTAGPDRQRTVVMEVAGIWVDECGYGIKSLTAFRKKIGVEDEDGCFGCYVGGDKTAWNKNASLSNSGASNEPATQTSIIMLDDFVGGNYFTWGVLENAQGKTTEMIR